MARQINEESTRQLVFVRLDEMVSLQRKEALDTIVAEFDMKVTYARTLYQQHRKTLITSGVLVETFTIREKDGRPVIVSHHKAKGQLDGEYTTPKKALSVYKRGLEARLRAVEKLAS